ncbi:FHA domain-containing protein [Paractinoplanes durhamensis]|uniref:Serine/threonine protein kinase n=1 Tax=Paractinoplanes durhamensis TaxID=113563 RepID=A0ABQ3YX38_9ACTN|nr:FHA domain-containing protein [Actinoplanes durhamensis]GIE02160.1 hypothetical protein Adu01nite_35100 [Actinoplanes durhamensis]
MPGVLIQIPSDADKPELVRLPPGGTATFGRGGSGRTPDVPLPHPAVSRLAGQLTATADFWLISNFSAERTYVVDNPEGGGEHLKIAPRRIDAPVPFEFARVVIPVPDGEVSFLVYAPEHTYADPARDGAPTGPATMPAFSLDESAKYFLILVALCEPRLRDSSSVAIPLIPEIVDRLHGALTRSAVNFHIDYLAEHKLRLRQRDTAGQRSGRLDHKREALVSCALRFNLVAERHLALLPPPPGAR